MYVKSLYIPYSSDKTLTNNNFTEISIDFISHIVQIKQLVFVKPKDLKTFIFISHIVQIKLKTAIRTNENVLEVFISHIVQIKHKDQ